VADVEASARSAGRQDSRKAGKYAAPGGTWT
jgi:hypothetical protein